MNIRESETITVRLSNTFLNDLDRIKEIEEKYYHFVGNRSDLLKIIISNYKNYLEREIIPLYENNKTTG